MANDDRRNFWNIFSFGIFFAVSLIKVSPWIHEVERFAFRLTGLRVWHHIWRHFFDPPGARIIASTYVHKHMTLRIPIFSSFFNKPKCHRGYSASGQSWGGRYDTSSCLFRPLPPGSKSPTGPRFLFDSTHAIGCYYARRNKKKTKMIVCGAKNSMV